MENNQNKKSFFSFLSLKKTNQKKTRVKEYLSICEQEWKKVKTIADLHLDITDSSIKFKDPKKSNNKSILSEKDIKNKINPSLISLLRNLEKGEEELNKLYQDITNKNKEYKDSEIIWNMEITKLNALKDEIAYYFTNKNKFKEATSSMLHKDQKTAFSKILNSGEKPRGVFEDYKDAQSAKKSQEFEGYKKSIEDKIYSIDRNTGSRTLLPDNQMVTINKVSFTVGQLRKLLVLKTNEFTLSINEHERKIEEQISRDITANKNDIDKITIEEEVNN